MRTDLLGIEYTVLRAPCSLPAYDRDSRARGTCAQGTLPLSHRYRRRGREHLGSASGEAIRRRPRGSSMARKHRKHMAGESTKREVSALKASAANTHGA